MSAETFQRLVRALEDHMASESDDGAVLTDWYLVAAGVKAADWGVSTYMHLCSESPFHTLYGLAMMAHQKLDDKRLGHR